MDRDFLFGVIAVQLGQASPAQVMAAAAAHVANPSKSIPDRLREEGVFDDDRFNMIESMVEGHTAWVNSVEFSPDDKLLITSS